MASDTSDSPSRGAQGLNGARAFGLVVGFVLGMVVGVIFGDAIMPTTPKEVQEECERLEAENAKFREAIGLLRETQSQPPGGSPEEAAGAGRAGGGAPTGPSGGGPGGQRGGGRGR